MTEKAPLVETLTVDTVYYNAGYGQNFVLGPAPFDAVVTAAAYIPSDDIADDPADYRTWTVINAGQDGEGDAAIATLSSDAASLAAGDVAALAIDADVAEVNEGDVLLFANIPVSGTGVADPGGQASVTLSRR